ncbi:hypothetical protein ACVWXO_000850 [Bradyrhizobium sp. LM2.7]
MNASQAYTGSSFRSGRTPWRADTQAPQNYAQHVSSRLYASYGIPDCFVEALLRRGPISHRLQKVFGRGKVLANRIIPICLRTADIDKRLAERKGGVHEVLRLREVSITYT